MVQSWHSLEKPKENHEKLETQKRLALAVLEYS
jgi:hypothetical protein